MTDFIELVGAVDARLGLQAAADTDYFLRVSGRPFDIVHVKKIADAFLAAYRWQYILSGAQHPHFVKLLSGMTTQAQMQRIVAALGPFAG